MTSSSTSKGTPVALITGAAKRLGACTARALHRLGYDIVIHHHTSADEAQALAAELNALRAASADTLCQDLAQDDAGAAIIAAFSARRAARCTGQQCFGVRRNAALERQSRGLGTPAGHQPARAVFFERACRAIVARQSRRGNRQHHRHPQRTAARRLQRLLCIEGGPGGGDARSGTGTRARGARQRGRARSHPVGRQRRRAIAGRDPRRHAARAARRTAGHRPGGLLSRPGALRHWPHPRRRRRSAAWCCDANSGLGRRRGQRRGPWRVFVINAEVRQRCRQIPALAGGVIPPHLFVMQGADDARVRVRNTRWRQSPALPCRRPP